MLSLPSQIKPYQQEGDKKFGLVRRILAPGEAATVRTVGEFFLFLIDKDYAFLYAEASRLNPGVECAYAQSTRKNTVKNPG